MCIRDRRKLIRRVYKIARTQFDGGTRILETLQETLQGIRIVKAFTLEDIMRERFDRNVAAVEHEANKMARVSNRASPLMETCLLYTSPSPRDRTRSRMPSSA